MWHLDLGVVLDQLERWFDGFSGMLVYGLLLEWILEYFLSFRDMFAVHELLQSYDLVA